MQSPSSFFSSYHPLFHTFIHCKLHLMRIFLSLLTFLTISLSVSSQPLAYYQSARYLDPLGQAYLDLIFNIDANSLANKNAKTDTISSHDIYIEIKITDEKDSIINFSKTNVSSPNFAIDAAEKYFLDLKRLQVTPGILTVSILLEDLNKIENNHTNFSEKIFVEENKNFSAQLSDMIFLGDILPGNAQSPFNRNDKILIPYLNNYFPDHLNKILFYTEIYNSKQQFPGGKFAYSYQIEHPETGAIIKDKQRLKRGSSADIVPVVGSINIDDLPSGKYIFRFQLRNTQNEVLLSQTKEIYRENRSLQLSPTEIEDLVLANSFIGKVTSDSLLNDYIACLLPIAEQHEKNMISQPEKAFKTVEEKQRYFLNFWMQRNATQPSLAWYHYKKDVDLVQRLFGTSIKRGYESDRGRVYLQYGPPSTRVERPSEPVSYPYEL